MNDKTKEAGTELPVDENQIIAERRGKLSKLREKGQAFPNSFKPEHRAADLHARYGLLDKETLDPQGIEVSVSGRMMLKRVMGKASFATIQVNPMIAFFPSAVGIVESSGLHALQSEIRLLS